MLSEEKLSNTGDVENNNNLHLNINDMMQSSSSKRQTMDPNQRSYIRQHFPAEFAKMLDTHGQGFMQIEDKYEKVCKIHANKIERKSIKKSPSSRSRNVTRKIKKVS